MRKAFTLAEVLVAMLLFLMISGICYELWTGGVRGFTKGEDALTTAQEASAVILHLRHDLAALAVPKDPKEYLLRFEKIGGGRTIKEEVHLDTAARALSKVQFRNDAEGSGTGAMDRTVLQLRVWDERGQGMDEVTYRYEKQKASITRQVANRPPQEFAVPRLQDFDFQMLYQLEGSEAPIEAFLWSSINQGVLQQTWFRVRFMVKAEAQAGVETTKVEIESHIFPKHLHRRLRARWIDPP